MSLDKVPDKDHIARLCKPSQIQDGVIMAPAFMLRIDEGELSVNWLEILRYTDRENELVEIRNIYSKKFRVSKNARFAILNVGELCKNVFEESPDNRTLEVLHTPIYNSDPEKEDQSHSEIFNLKYDDELIAELIIEAIQDTYPAYA